MQRDMDLIRSLLLLIEAKQVASLIKTEDIEIEGYNDTQIGLHMNLLADAKLIVCEPIYSSSNSSRVVKVPFVFELSWLGHEYLDSIRDPKIWNKTKSYARKAGSGSLEFMLEIAKAYAKESLRKHGLVVS